MEQNNNPFRGSSYFISVNQYEQLPDDEQIEVAFAGRSNAGKSSAINTLVDNQNLCRISKTPGRTQMINYFQLPNSKTIDNSQRFIVDLPGYGYAKVPLETKHHWQDLLGKYLAERDSLKGVVMIMDIRHPMTEYDEVMMKWCLDAQMPSHILLTKADKLKPGASKKTLQQVKQNIRQTYPDTSIQLFSSLKKTGVENLINQLNDWYY
ncbi:MAG: YihA family ribosome biogenesis GTP-binding protein [Gammaproteobacteria bacterium]|nr:YihA family ribosome biogenesis GTP-binding protein [Gammaproteobacteria bacterium]